LRILYECEFVQHEVPPPIGTFLGEALTVDPESPVPAYLVASILADDTPNRWGLNPPALGILERKGLIRRAATGYGERTYCSGREPRTYLTQSRWLPSGRLLRVEVTTATHRYAVYKAADSNEVDHHRDVEGVDYSVTILDKDGERKVCSGFAGPSYVGYALTAEGIVVAEKLVGAKTVVQPTKSVQAGQGSRTTGLRVDLDRRVAYWNEQQLEINDAADFTVLHELYAAEGTIVRHAKLARAVRPSSVSDKAELNEALPLVKEACSHIRRAFGRVRCPLQIKPVRRRGYQLCPPGEEST